MIGINKKLNSQQLGRRGRQDFWAERDHREEEKSLPARQGGSRMGSAE